MNFVALVLFLALLLLSVRYSAYRHKLHPRKKILDLGFSKTEDNYGRDLCYKLSGQQVSPWEVPFLKFDFWLISLSSEMEEKTSYYKDGKLLTLTPGLAVQIVRYEEALSCAYRSTEGRPERNRCFTAMKPPYDTKETIFTRWVPEQGFSPRYVTEIKD